jgi:hypothetical protein
MMVEMVVLAVEQLEVELQELVLLLKDLMVVVHLQLLMQVVVVELEKQEIQTVQVKEAMVYRQL